MYMNELYEILFVNTDSYFDGIFEPRFINSKMFYLREFCFLNISGRYLETFNEITFKTISQYKIKPFAFTESELKYFVENNSFMNDLLEDIADYIIKFITKSYIEGNNCFNNRLHLDAFMLQFCCSSRVVYDEDFRIYLMNVYKEVFDFVDDFCDWD